MSYFHPQEKTELVVDASPVGLGAILAQRTAEDSPPRVVAYASRSLSPTEQKYSQTEREALAIVWGCEHFHLYLYGAPFTLVTDHKPLELIFSNPHSKPPARIERWGLRLQQYNYNIVHKSGKDNPADYMSRHPKTPVCKKPLRATKSAEQFVHLITQNAVPTAMTVGEVSTETNRDIVLQKVIELVKNGNWENMSADNSDPVLKSFNNIRDELTVSEDGLLLRGHRLVIPTSLQQKAVQLAHEGHQGITKTKSLLREKVWFPGIDSLAESAVNDCLMCQANVNKVKPQPLLMSDLPDAPWTEISMDFCGPFPTGEYLLVMVDDYTRYPVVEFVTTTTAKAVLPVMDKVFAMFGIPRVVKTDNGPPFQGKEFANFSTYLGFQHRKITPLWPQANGTAEKLMSSLGKTIRSAVMEGRNWKLQLYTFLRNYRATAHTTTGQSPSQLLFGRSIHTKLPDIQERPSDSTLRNKDETSKRRMKTYADKRRAAKSTSVQVGDHVLVKQKKINKFTSPFCPTPYRVVNVKGSMITARAGSSVVTRNLSHFKRVRHNPTDYHRSSEDDDDLPLTPQSPVNEQPPVPTRYPPRERRPTRYLIEEM